MCKLIKANPGTEHQNSCISSHHITKYNCTGQKGWCVSRDIPTSSVPRDLPLQAKLKCHLWYHSLNQTCADLPCDVMICRSSGVLFLDLLNRLDREISTAYFCIQTAAAPAAAWISKQWLHLEAVTVLAKNFTQHMLFKSTFAEPGRADRATSGSKFIEKRNLPVTCTSVLQNCSYLLGQEIYNLLQSYIS